MDLFYCWTTFQRALGAAFHSDIDFISSPAHLLFFQLHLFYAEVRVSASQIFNSFLSPFSPINPLYCSEGQIFAEETVCS